MNYIYIVSILILFLLTIILKKSNNKLNIIVNIIFTVVGFLGYQLIISLLMSSLNIPINLLCLIIVNVISIISCLIFIMKKGVQKFYFDKKDMVSIFVLIILTVFIANKHFDGLEKIKYFSTDASIHYIAAKEFSENDKLLNETQGTQTYKQMLPMLYTNVGLMFKAFEPIVGVLNLYKIYIAFDIIIFLLIALTFYCILKKAIKSSK